MTEPDARVWPPTIVQPIVLRRRPDMMLAEVVAAPERTMILLSLLVQAAPGEMTVEHDVITVARTVDYRVVSWDAVRAAFVVQRIADRRYQ